MVLDKKSNDDLQAKIDTIEKINQQLRENNEEQFTKAIEIGKQNQNLREWITKNRLLNEELDQKDAEIAEMAPQI